MRRLAPLTVLPLLLLTIALLAGCGTSSNGVSSKGAPAILAASIAAAKNATSVRVSSETSERALMLGYQMEMTSQGAQGQVKLPGLSYEVVRLNDEVYVRGTRALYQHLGKAAAKLQPGTWIVAPTTSGALQQVAQMADLTSEFDRIQTDAGDVTKGSTTTLNGQPAIELKPQRKLGTTVLYVATTGKPYPIQILRHGALTGKTTFTDWNKPVTVTPPANAVELSQLHHKAG